MSGYGVSYLSGSPWLGVLAAGLVGMLMGALHAWLCARPRVNDIAVGIALMLFGVGLAFFLGKSLIKPTAPRLPAFGTWAGRPRVPRLSKRRLAFAKPLRASAVKIE